MMGIRDVSTEGNSVCITCDLLDATTEQIEKKLEEVGVQLGGGVAERLRRACHLPARNRGSFSGDEALLKLFCLALNNIRKKWSMEVRD